VGRCYEILPQPDKGFLCHSCRVVCCSILTNPSQTGTKAEKIQLKKWYNIFKDHITLSDYEIKDGMNLELCVHPSSSPFGSHHRRSSLLALIVFHHCHPLSSFFSNLRRKKGAPMPPPPVLQGTHTCPSSRACSETHPGTIHRQTAHHRS
jgi:hypothetical protein